MQVLIDRVMRERKTFDIEHRLLMPDGSVKYLHVIGHPSENESGNLEVVGAVTDITERKVVGSRASKSSGGEPRNYAINSIERISPCGKKSTKPPCSRRLWASRPLCRTCWRGLLKVAPAESTVLDHRGDGHGQGTHRSCDPQAVQTRLFAGRLSP